jgi:hypothetical protein
MKPNPKKAKKHLEHLRKLVAQRSNPFEGMTEEQIIEQLRKTREELWNEKINKLRSKKVASGS